jgi:hypothetical protein
MHLYTIFYNECKPVSIDRLKEFSYNHTSISPVEKRDIQISEKKEDILIQAESDPDPKNLLHKIEEQCMKATGVQDGLFWSMYIAVYGYNEYLRNKYNYGKLEVNEKQKISEYLLSVGSNNIKTNYRLTRSFCGEIVADLTSLPRMVMSGLIGMSAYYKSDIYIIDIVKNTYVYFLYLGEDTPSKDTIVLYKNPLHTKKFNSNEYFVDIGLTIQTLDEIHENYVGIEHYQKPLKGISTYLKTDLEEIAGKTVFKEQKPVDSLSKQELYNTIWMHLSSL